MIFYLTLASVYTGKVMSKGWEIIWIFWSLSNHLPPPQIFLLVSVFCCCSGTKLRLAPWDPMEYTPQASLSFTVSWSLLKLIFIESVMLSSHLILCCPLLLPSIFFSIRIFSSESALHIRWPKYWSFSFIISPSNEYSGLISFRIDRFDLLALQGTLTVQKQS